MSSRLSFFAMAICLMSACSLRQAAVNQTVDMLETSLPAFESESDLELASQSLPATIKIAEGLLRSAPQNADLALLLARAYSAYALVVVEEKLHQAKENAAKANELSAPEVDRQKARVSKMYRRAHRYGIRALARRHTTLAKALVIGKGSKTAIAPLLARCQKEDVPALFFAAMPLVAALGANTDDIALVAEIPRLRAIAARIAALDEGYNYAGAHLMLGSLYGASSKLLGGNQTLAQKHFERALAQSKRSYLLVQQIYAQTYAVQKKDKVLFGKLLKEVIKAPMDVLPAQNLANIIAKRRAKRLMTRIDELF